jgi:hypothetical protein
MKPQEARREDELICGKPPIAKELRLRLLHYVKQALQSGVTSRNQKGQRM